MQNTKVCLNIREPQVLGGGGQDVVSVQQAAGQLIHVGQAAEIFVAYVGYPSRTKLLKYLIVEYFL